MPRKILHLIDSFSVGGAEQLLLNLAQRMDKSRFELHLIGLSTFNRNCLQPQFERTSLPVHVIGTRHFYDLRAALWLIRYIKQQRIELVHTHLDYADVLGRVVGALMRRPVVSTLHNQPAQFDQERFDRRWAQQISARFSNVHLVALSARLRTQFSEQWHIPAHRITAIYNGIALEPYLAIPPPARHRSVGLPLVITTIGRLDEQKGQQYLLEAATLVLAQHPQTRFQIVGQGPLKPHLQAQAETLGIADSVTLLGLRHDIPAILAQSDVFVLPSRREGMPLVIVEAMAAARPIVLTNVGGNSELVAHGQHGLLVPPNDSTALATALLRLADDPNLAATLGAAARERAKQHFDIALVVARYAALYEAMLASSQLHDPP